jgi:hypothetical protein
MPGFPSQYSKELWQQARDLVAAGLPFSEVAERTGIGFENLRKKAQRENWLVPATALNKNPLQLSSKREEGQVSQKSPTDLVLAESVEEMGQKAKVSALKGLLPVFSETFKEGSELLSQPVDNWKNAGSMTNIVSKLLGWDRPATAVQVNVTQWGKYQQGEVDGKTYDV